MTTLNSPDTPAPSLADTSMGSPDQSIGIGEASEEGAYAAPEPVKEQVTPRRLWFSHDGDMSAFTMYNICHFQSSPLATKTEVTYKSEAFSTTSSETTAIAGKNLTTKTTEVDDGFFLKVCLGDIMLNEDNARSPPISQIRETPPRSDTGVVDELPNDIPSCSSALNMTPRQIAELFGTFQKSRKTKETLSSPSTPEEELLLRECTLLKQIIKDDSKNIIHLKQTLEHQQNILARKDIDLEDMDVEIRMALDRIDALKREKEIMREREDEFNDTIRILKLEVDKLSTMDVSSEKDEKEMVTSNIGEPPNQNALSVEEYVHLPVKSHSVTVSLDDDARKVEVDGFRSQDEPRQQLASLEMMLQDIAQRLVTIEAKNNDSEQRYLLAFEKHRTEIDGIREVLHLERKSGDLLTISQHPDEVEIMLPNNTHKTQSQSMPDADLGCCCKFWIMN
jgi:hypothetical protein